MQFRDILHASLCGLQPKHGFFQYAEAAPEQNSDNNLGSIMTTD